MTVSSIYAQQTRKPNATERNPARPNVIFILTDDQGYGDLACHGNPWIKTPNLDKLYSQSTCFTNFHVGTTCAPSRAGLLTGKYSNKVGVWHTVNGREILAAQETTLGEVFQQAGYRTAIFGKWHLGDNYPFRPQDRGFDEVLIHGGGGVGQQPDYWNNDYFDDTYFRNGKPESFTGYCTDVWFSEATRFVEKNRQKPFLCYLALNAPHSPYHVPEAYSNHYKDNPAVPNANFYGMITNIDENIGKLRERLQQLGLADNTILVFMTDNGTSAGVKFGKAGEVLTGYNAGMRGIKGSPYEGGHRVPFFLHWPNGNLRTHQDISTITSYIDLMPTLLDLCSIKSIRPIAFDGQSLTPLLRKPSPATTERIVFTDRQREELLVKWKQPAIMTDRWRLIGQNELYEIKTDPGQARNVAANHPDVVEKLKRAYESWWAETSKRADTYSYVKIEAGNTHPVQLNSHDCHVETGMPAWSQEDVRRGVGGNGFWAVEFTQPGTYTFELYRYPKESKQGLGDAAPEGEPIPGAKPYPPGEALTLKEARIKVGNLTQTKAIRPGDQFVTFMLTVPAGQTFVQSWLIDNKGTERPAYYVYVK